MIMASPASLAEHPLFERLFGQLGYANLGAETVDAFGAESGEALLFFAEDPARVKETLDLAVILPEIDKAFAGRFRVGVLLPEAAHLVARRYGFRRWPALVMLRGGEYVGTIDGIQDWDVYIARTAELLASPASRPPSIGIPVAAAGGGADSCH
jgi:hydrogenase-1 operon protein HyaE